MARTSLLVLGVVVSSSACLVTGSPDFSPPERTRPQLIAVTPTTEFIRPAFVDGAFQPSTIAAEVLSEDAGEPLEAVLLVDYGYLASDNTPWRDSAPVDDIAPGTLSEGPRPINVTWTPRSFIQPGCHTVTLLVTHQKRAQNPGYWCPAEPDDYDTLTWFVALCEDLATCDYSDCFIAGEDTYSYCEGGEQADAGAPGGGP
ncbi:MAG: hypothetical protein JRI68_04260 [Deltaproteobacteria bacterium]|nr:hypothetical protein [Deltaproteobacteria bacterium]